MIVGGTDGSFHAIKVNTGEPIWRIDVSKRAILNSVLYRDGIAYITHGEENIGTTEMGMIAALDARRTGDLKDDAFKWKTLGFLPTYASPVMDAERLYTVDNSAIVAAFELKTGRRLWERGLGTLQKGSPVLADGKLYVGTENGKFFILRPSATGVEVLDEELLGTTADARTDRRFSDRGGRPRLCDVDGSDLCDRQARAAGHGGSGESRRRPRAALRRTGDLTCRCSPTTRCWHRAPNRRSRLKLYDAKGALFATKPAAATWAVDQLAAASAPTAPTPRRPLVRAQGSSRQR